MMKDNDYAKDDKPVEVSTLLQTIADPRATPGERLNAATNIGLQPVLSVAEKLAVAQALGKEPDGSLQKQMLMRVLTAHTPSAMAVLQNRL